MKLFTKNKKTNAVKVETLTVKELRNVVGGDGSLTGGTSTTPTTPLTPDTSADTGMIRNIGKHGSQRGFV